MRGSRFTVVSSAPSHVIPTKALSTDAGDFADEDEFFAQTGYCGRIFGAFQCSRD